MTDQLHEFTDDNFQLEVLQSDQPVLVDFWAEWCQPCHAVAPTIAALAGEYAGRVKVGKLDTDVNQDVAARLGISAIPSIILFNDGAEVRRFVGVTPKGELAAALEGVGNGPA